MGRPIFVRLPQHRVERGARSVPTGRRRRAAHRGHRRRWLRDRQAGRDRRAHPPAAIIAVMLLYSYREQLKRKIYWLYGGGGLFIMGLGIRALLVGRT